MLQFYDKLYEEYYCCEESKRQQIGALISKEGEDILNNSQPWFGLNQEPRETEIIVSLTSISERLGCVIYSIECMLVQTVRPDRIILWLDEKICDGLLPEKLLDLKGYGLEIKYVEDVGPHKKYYYAMQQYPKAMIITIDDDVFYKRTLIEGLLDTYKQHPGCICAYRVRRMKFTGNGIPYPYVEFRQIQEELEIEPSHNLMAVGVSGVLYPPHLLNELIFDLSLIKRLSYKADDIWLKAIEVISNVKVAKVEGKHLNEPFIKDSQRIGLCYTNIIQNDRWIKNIFQFFNLSEYYKNEKNIEYFGFDLLEKWIKLYSNGLRIKDYLFDHNYKTVAIYGIGRIGRLLLQDLIRNDVAVLYGIDLRAEYIQAEVPVIKLKQLEKAVDLVIIAANVDYKQLKSQIQTYIECDVLMFEDILVEMLWKNLPLQIQ